MKGGLLTAWLAEVVVITYRTVSRGSNGPISHLPLPSTYVSTMIIYGGLGFLPESANGFATIFGWGLVVATFLNLWVPGKVNAQGLPQVASAAQVQGGNPVFGSQVALSEQVPGPINPKTGYPSNIPIVT